MSYYMKVSKREKARYNVLCEKWGKISAQPPTLINMYTFCIHSRLPFLEEG